MTPVAEFGGQYKPGGQGPHVTEPGDGANFDEGHAKHMDEFALGLNWPAGQGKQAASEVELVFGLKVPLLQEVHAEEPFESANVPAGHGAHDEADVAPREGLLVPRLQDVHSLSAKVSPYDPALHSWHSAFELAPGFGPYVPSLHGRQAAE